MARKKKIDRNDPKSNKSLAIREVLSMQPELSAQGVVDVVQETYGHKVTKNIVYMIRTKMNNLSGGKRAKATKGQNQRLDVQSIAYTVSGAKALLDGCNGDVEAAIQVLHAIKG